MPWKKKEGFIYVCAYMCAQTHMPLVYMGQGKSKLSSRAILSPGKYLTTSRDNLLHNKDVLIPNVRSVQVEKP